MRRLIAALLLIPAGSFFYGCAPDRGASNPPHPPVAAPGSSGSSSSGAGTPSEATPDPEKSKQRASTPPGTDRAGGGPADGAIKDPSGAATGQPEPR